MTLKTILPLGCAVVLWGVAAMYPAAQAPSPAAAQVRVGSAYTLVPAPFGVQLKTPDNRVVFEYLTKKPDDVALTSPSTACFHPVNTPSGERVTSLAPDDHPHHRGMYLAWHDAEFRQPIVAPTTPTAPAFGWSITRADFWGWGQYAPRDGRIIQNREVKLTAADAAHALVELHNDWNVTNRKMVDEMTTV